MPKVWKPRTHTRQLQQRTQRRLRALNRVDETGPLGLDRDALVTPEVRRQAQSLDDKLQRLTATYGPAEAVRLIDDSLDRLLKAGVQ